MLHINTPEPHAERKREILAKYPQVQELFGYDYRTSIIVVALVVVQLGIAWWVQQNAELFLSSWWWLLLLSYVVGGTLNHWCAMGMHEASHNLAAKSTLANRWIAIFANIPILIPGAMTFRRYHMLHHTYMGIQGKDNDLPTSWEEKYVGNSTWRKFVWQVLFLLVMGVRGIMNRPSRWEAVNMVFCAITTTLILVFIGSTGSLYLLLGTLFGFGLHPTAGHYVHEHFVLREGQETYSYYGALNHVTFNVGYHFEHHDFIHIPGWLLPKYKDMTKEYYEPLLSHRSWVWVLYNFIANPKISAGSRFVRNHETFKSGFKKVRGGQLATTSEMG